MVTANCLCGPLRVLCDLCGYPVLTSLLARADNRKFNRKERKEFAKIRKGKTKWERCFQVLTIYHYHSPFTNQRVHLPFTIHHLPSSKPSTAHALFRTGCYP